MKILLSGYHNPHFLTITEYMESAIKELGHKLFVFEDRQHIIPGRFRYRINWLNQLSLQHINRNMVSLALKERPDVAIVTGGHRINAKTIRALKKNGINTVLWTIDPPRLFQTIINIAPLYDYIFCQGTEAIELLNQAGVKGAQWLPVACDPDLHKPIELSAKEKIHYGSDVVFVGSYYPNRLDLLAYLAGFDLAVWGPGWEQLGKKSPLVKHVKAAYTSPSEWVKIYSASRIVLAFHYQDPNDSFPVYQASPRVFEAIACGAFLLCDNQRDVLSLFKSAEHMATFVDENELTEKAKYYLDHAAEGETIARQGRIEVLANHTYVHRIEKLLSSIDQRA